MAEVDELSLIPSPVKSVDEVRRMAAFPLDAMLQAIGPLALLQRPGAQSAQASMHQLASRTLEIQTPPPVARQALSLLLEVKDGLVVPLGAQAPDGEWVFGRGEDADVRLDDPSVSGRHAAVRWDAWKRNAWVRDLGSTNGTLLDGQEVKDERPLSEGNILTLGDDTAFLFLRTETLYALLKQR